MEIVIGWFILAGVVAIIAANYGRSGAGWFLLALFLSPILAGIILLAIGRVPQVDNDAPSPSTHVRCPDCRELVRMDARKCKHCGSVLQPQLPTTP